MTKYLRADLSMAIRSLLWGATFVVVKNALDHASVFIFLAVRFSVASLLMLAWNSRVIRQFEREDLFAGPPSRVLHVPGLRVSGRRIAVHHARKVRVRHRFKRRARAAPPRTLLGKAPNLGRLRRRSCRRSRTLLPHHPRRGHRSFESRRRAHVCGRGTLRRAFRSRRRRRTPCARRSPGQSALCAGRCLPAKRTRPWRP